MIPSPDNRVGCGSCTDLHAFEVQSLKHRCFRGANVWRERNSRIRLSAEVHQRQLCGCLATGRVFKGGPISAALHLPGGRFVATNCRRPLTPTTMRRSTALGISSLFILWMNASSRFQPREVSRSSIAVHPRTITDALMIKDNERCHPSAIATSRLNRAQP